MHYLLPRFWLYFLPGALLIGLAVVGLSLLATRTYGKRKRAERSLRMAKVLWERTFNAVPDLIAILDCEHRIVQVNKAMADRLGTTPAACQGQHCFKSVHHTPCPLGDCPHSRMMRERMECSLEVHEPNLGGDFMVSVSPLYDEAGTLIGGVHVARDITQRKKAKTDLRENNHQLQEARGHLAELNNRLEQRVAARTARIEQLLLQKSEFMNQLGHDLKTPLTPLVALLPLLLENRAPARTAEMLQVCVRNVQYMKDLVFKTLDLFQLDSPALGLQMQSALLARLCGEALVDRLAGAQNQSIHTQCDIDPDLTVWADPLRLREVLDNLLENALRHMPKGGRLCLSATARNKWVTISVIDTGEGIAPRHLPRIFDEFYKVDASRHDRRTCGLGLSICKRIIQQHGGRIWANSAGEGLGATFLFTLRQTGDPSQQHDSTGKIEEAVCTAF